MKTSPHCITKLSATLDTPITYHWHTDSTSLPFSSYIGRHITIAYQQAIYCMSCKKKTKKSFMNGYCFRCFQSSPETSPCILRPELCQAHEGIGRDMDWEKKHHLQPHTVYLSYTGNIKVGVTRDTQIPTRWIDQGATQAIVLAETPNRYLAGCIEVALKAYVSDRTSWQTMLKLGNSRDVDLYQSKQELIPTLPKDLQAYATPSSTPTPLHYPIDTPSQKVKSITCDKAPLISGTLTGIKGQYLLFDQGTVFNVRRHSGYQVVLDIE